MNELTVRTHRGSCRVSFGTPFAGLENGTNVLIIDRKVSELYADRLGPRVTASHTHIFESTEENKSVAAAFSLLERLLAGEIRRDTILTAVGGGIVHDVAGFIAGVLFRGIAWRYYPTTLLAQADCCVGGKTALNAGGYKNCVGMFSPPRDVFISVDFLETLETRDFFSGVGELVKMAWLRGIADFEEWTRDPDILRGDKAFMKTSIFRSLQTKKEIVEADEWDHGKRVLLNYGHTFGHAIESASGFEVPHGIAIAAGMDMANYISFRLGFLARSWVEKAHACLRRIYSPFLLGVPREEKFWEAVKRDKKRTGRGLGLVLTRGPGEVFRHEIPDWEGLQYWGREFWAQQ